MPPIKRCPKCKNIYWADEQHECPSPEYTALHDKMVSEAAEDDPGEEWEPRNVESR